MISSLPLLSRSAAAITTGTPGKDDGTCQAKGEPSLAKSAKVKVEGERTSIVTISFLPSPLMSPTRTGLRFRRPSLGFAKGTVSGKLELNCEPSGSQAETLA